MLVIIVMDAAPLDVLVAPTLSSLGHGCCDSGCAGSTDVIILGPWNLRQWMCWSHGHYHPWAMDAATLKYGVICQYSCQGCMVSRPPFPATIDRIRILSRPLAASLKQCKYHVKDDAVPISVSCDSGCAGSTDVIILGPWMLRQRMCW